MADNTEKDFLDESAVALNSVTQKFELFFDRYKNIILGLLLAIVVIIGGYFAYNKFVKEPKEKKSKDAIFKAQNYFEQDSFALALNGDGQNLGFKAIANQFSGSGAGNTSNFYAGICYLKMDKYQDAITYLEKFNTDNELLNARKYGCLGDAYAETNKMETAIDMYKKAVAASNNETVAPTYLYRLALAQEQKGQKKEALENYKRVNIEFPQTQEGMASEIVIAKLEASN